ncbi:MAG: hypothetical protein HN345_02155 [Planctomycetaceae bacterium]|mgnify:CR=1 FL=1|jgi:hypothetical protein|nr:hypothetical protein [Planctomycetaceae bacterium]
MAKVLFIDDRLDEVIRQWQSSGCASNHELLPLEPFDSIERTCQMVNTFEPDVILIGYGLGKPDITGADVIRSLHEGGYSGYIIANSGSGTEQFNRAGVEIDGTANRSPRDLQKVVNNLTERRREK